MREAVNTRTVNNRTSEETPESTTEPPSGPLRGLKSKVIHIQSVQEITQNRKTKQEKKKQKNGCDIVVT